MNQPASKKFTNNTFLLWPGCIGIIASIVFADVGQAEYWLPGIIGSLSFLTLNFIGFHYRKIPQPSPKLIMAVLFFCAGIVSYKQQCASHERATKKLFKQKWITGSVATHDETVSGPFAYKTEIILDKNDWGSPFNPNYSVMIFHSDDAISTEQRLIFHVRNLTENSNTSPSLRRYSLKHHRLASVFLYKKSRIIKEPDLFTSFFGPTRQWLDDLFKQKLSEQTYLMYASIFLGKKIPQTKQWLRQFCAHWGISHFLARSGLHLVIYLFVWQLLLTLLPLTLGTRAFSSVLLLFLYNFLTWQSISFIRAFTVAILFCTGTLWKRQGSFVHLLALVFILILLFNPAQLFALDFQLTFALTFALSLSLNKIILPVRKPVLAS